MAVTYTCDNCGKPGAGRAVFYFTVSEPHKVEKPPKFDGELCPACLERVMGIMVAALPPAKDKSR